MRRASALGLALALGASSLAGAGGCRRGTTTSREGGGPAGARFVDGAALAQGTPRDGGTVRIHVDAEPPTLDPLVEHDVWSTWIARAAIYDTLLAADATTGAPLPRLATAWRWLDDRTLRLTLRRDVRWHDGRPFTALDVLFTVGRLLDAASGVAADRRADWQALAGATRVSDDEVELRFRTPAPLALVALAELPVLPAHAFSTTEDLRTQKGSRAPVGTGPFRFVSWAPGERIVLARNDAWWGGRAHVERVELVIARDKEVAFTLARRGALDLVPRLGPGQVARALTDGELGRAEAKLVALDLPSYSFIVWNTRRPGLADARVRRALGHLVDGERYVAVAYGGRATRTSGPFPVGAPSYDRTVAPDAYDPARARALLDEAGVVDHDGDGVREVDGRPFTLAFLVTAGSRTVEPLATMLAEDAAKVGVRVELVTVDWAAQLDRLRHGAFDASALAFTVRPVQDDAPLFHTATVDGSQNYGGFSDAECDRLLDALGRTPPGDERAALERALHRRLHELAPYTFLAAPESDALVAARLHGVEATVDSLGLERMWLDPP